MQEPLFVLTPNRPLTALARAMIGNHPDMFGLAETNLFAAETCQGLMRMSRIYERFQHGLLRSIAELGLGAQTEENIDIARSWLNENSALTTEDLFKDLMAMAEPRHVIDSSIVYVYRPGVADRIVQEFPDAYYMHLVMHPRQTCELAYEDRRTAEENFQSSDSIPRLALEPVTIWLQPHMRILTALESVPTTQKMFLRGEDLISEPEKYLGMICQWLDIRSDDESTSSMMRPEESPFSSFGPQNAPLGNDPHFVASSGALQLEKGSQDLDRPLSWDSELTFDDSVKQLATNFGYCGRE